MNQETFQSSKQQLQLNIHLVFTNIQTHCSGFLHHLSQNLPLSNPKHSSLQSQFLSNLSVLQNKAKQAFGEGFSHPNLPCHSSGPVWARIAENSKVQIAPVRQSGASMSNESIEERLAGVPVYALSNSDEEFVLVSGVSTKKSLGLLCFKKEDAESLLQQMKSMDPGMRKEGSKVVAVALNKVFQLKVDGVAFRLIPESAQVKNAIKERAKAGFSEDGFPGVPVFQSRSLVLRSQNKSYRPVFFRKEDLEKSLARASCQQKHLNPAFRQGDIQVAVFEEIIKGMKETSTSKWDDVVFIPPGFDVSADPLQQ